MQKQPATIAVPDAQARVAVASLVRETRAAAEIGSIADFPAAEHDRDIARPRIVWYSFHWSFPAWRSEGSRTRCDSRLAAGPTHCIVKTEYRRPGRSRRTRRLRQAAVLPHAAAQAAAAGRL